MNLDLVRPKGEIIFGSRALRARRLWEMVIENSLSRVSHQNRGNIHLDFFDNENEILFNALAPLLCSPSWLVCCSIFRWVFSFLVIILCESSHLISCDFRSDEHGTRIFYVSVSFLYHPRTSCVCEDVLSAVHYCSFGCYFPPTYEYFGLNSTWFHVFSSSLLYQSRITSVYTNSESMRWFSWFHFIPFSFSLALSLSLSPSLPVLLSPSLRLSSILWSIFLYSINEFESRNKRNDDYAVLSRPCQCMYYTFVVFD